MFTAAYPRNAAAPPPPPPPGEEEEEKEGEGAPPWMVMEGCSAARQTLSRSPPHGCTSYSWAGQAVQLTQAEESREPPPHDPDRNCAPASHARQSPQTLSRAPLQGWTSYWWAPQAVQSAHVKSPRLPWPHVPDLNCFPSTHELQLWQTLSFVPLHGCASY